MSILCLLLLQLISLAVLKTTFVVGTVDNDFAYDYDGDDDNDDYLREVLEEERRLEEEYWKRTTGGSPSPYDDDEPTATPNNRKEEERLEAEKEAAEKEARIARERAEKVRLQREAEFEAELARMNAQQQKAARRQKRRDARTVRRVLQATKKGRHYAVLGIRNWELKVGPRTLFRADTKDVRKAYRNRALAVHPDKNRDGRAQEAFVAVENSASILSDEKLRKIYDDEVRQIRQQRRHDLMQIAIRVVTLATDNIRRAIWLFRRILGPFATPILILGCLLI